MSALNESSYTPDWVMEIEFDDTVMPVFGPMLEKNTGKFGDKG
jgi:hypothetical protein